MLVNYYTLLPPYHGAMLSDRVCQCVCLVRGRKSQRFTAPCCPVALAAVPCDYVYDFRVGVAGADVHPQGEPSHTTADLLVTTDIES